MLLRKSKEACKIQSWAHINTFFIAGLLIWFMLPGAAGLTKNAILHEMR
jgi:hypothetical protein